MKLDDFTRITPGQKRMVVAVPFANDPDIIRSIAHAMREGMADFLLIGEQEKICRTASACVVDVGRGEFIRETDEQSACVRAVQLVHDGKAQVLIKGLVQSSSFLKAILNKQIGLVEHGHLISVAAFFEIPRYHKLLCITDPGVNIAPSLEEKKSILLNAISIVRLLGIDQPKVACIDAVEKVNPKIPSTLEAHALVEMGKKGVFGNALVEGPFGFDIAVSKKAAETKGVESRVAGDPDILLLPELRTANVLYKSLVWFAEARTASIVVGAKVPVVLTSRSDSEDSKYLSLALAIHQARQ
jgi:phosphate butyryltransferase